MKLKSYYWLFCYQEFENYRISAHHSESMRIGEYKQQCCFPSDNSFEFQSIEEFSHSQILEINKVSHRSSDE